MESDLQQLLLQAQLQFFILRPRLRLNSPHRASQSARRPLRIPSGLSSETRRPLRTVEQSTSAHAPACLSQFLNVNDAAHRTPLFCLLLGLLFLQQACTSWHLLQVCHQLSQLEDERNRHHCGHPDSATLVTKHFPAKSAQLAAYSTLRKG